MKIHTNNAEHNGGKALVQILEGAVIYCRLEGHITERVARDAMRQTKVYVMQLRQNGTSPKLLLDISAVTKQDSGARSAAKEIRTFGLEKIAVFGGNRLLKMVGQYILRSGNMANYSKIFSSRAPALRWLINTSTTPTSRKSKTFWVCISIGLVLAFVGLVGWFTGNPVLFNIGSVHRAVNPTTAATLLLVCAAAIGLKTIRSSQLRRAIVYSTAGWTLFFGIVVLLRFGFAIDLRVDTWLLGSQVEQGDLSARTSPIAALLFIALGAALLLTWQRSIPKWQDIILYITSLVLLVTPLVALVGYCFGISALYAPNGAPPTTILTIFSSLFIAIAILVLNASHRSGNKMLRSLLARFWQGVFVFFAIALLTGVVWQQSNRDLSQAKASAADESFERTTSTIANKIDAYVDALQGYKAFFAASGNVEPEEFSNYYRTANLAERYPGITAVTVVRNVSKNQQAQLTQQLRKDFPNIPAYKDYSIFPATTSMDTFPLIFLEPRTSTTRLGYDLSTEPRRLQTLQKARDTGTLTATGLINLRESLPGTKPVNGFFISIPIYKQINGADPQTVADRRNQIYGMVNAVVNDDRLFSNVFKGTDQKNLRYVVTTSNTKVFETAKPRAGQVLKNSKTVNILDQQWNIQMFADAGYGVGKLQQSIPYSVLIVGFLLAGLSSLLIISQTRRRDQAVQLASNMTEDLQLERNHAVTLQQKDEAILSSIGDAVFAIDTKGYITLFNPAAENISALPATEAIGKPYQDVLNFQFEATGRVNNSFIRDALNGKVSSMKNHTVLIRKDGSRVAVADSAAPIYDNNNVIQGVIVVFRDVSKEYELDKAKTEFVSLASHQLRTPLSAINWYAELLLSGDAGKLPKDASEYVREIFEGNQRMIELVNSLLDVSRLELGKLAYNPEPTDMIAITTSLEKELGTSLTTKNMTLKKTIQKPLHFVDGDPKQLRMIIQNLLSNAIKYSPEKNMIELELRDATSDEIKKAGLRKTPSLLVRIKDNGYGIPKAQQSKIFSKLFRADNVRVLDVEGTGLGLYIVKEVVTNMGGKVWFESIESAGTTFYAIIPYSPKKIKHSKS